MTFMPLWMVCFMIMLKCNTGITFWSHICNTSILSNAQTSAASHLYVSHTRCAQLLNLICATLLSVIQPEVPVLFKQTYPGTALTSRSPPNRLRLSLDCIRADLHPETPSPGPPSPDPEPPLGQSRCSSRTQSEASTAGLEELRVCGLGPEGGSRTPSPTLSVMSAVTVNMGLHFPPASTAHVTIHRQTLCHVCYCFFLCQFS